MAFFPLQQLIDKQDNFEIVRDQIAFLLINETVNQMNLATAAGKDPNDWNLDVYDERAQPWAKWLDPANITDEENAPIINIWYDTGSFPGNAGDIIRSQKHVATYNIDCYGLGLGQETATGQLPGDRVAAHESQRATRLVRNILMSSSNAYLQLPDIDAKPRLVSKRWVNSINSFQVPQGQNGIQNIVGTRISFSVEFIETSPQYDGEPLEEILVGISRAEDGLLLTELLIDFLNP